MKLLPGSRHKNKTGRKYNSKIRSFRVRLFIMALLFVCIGMIIAYRALSASTSVLYNGILTADSPTQIYDLTTGRGKIHAEVITTHPNIELVVQNDGDESVATTYPDINGSKRLHFEADPGTYSFIVTNKGITTTTVSFKLKISYPAKNSESPTAVIHSPKGGETLAGKIKFGANATDNTGVVRVDFYVNWQKIASDTQAPFEIEWDTTTVPNGIVTLTAKSYDDENNIGVGSISVTVDNESSEKPAGSSSTDSDGSALTPITSPPTSSSPTPPTITSMFFEGFNGNSGRERFSTGVFHRNITAGYPAGHGGTWSADHDMNCGSPETQRSLTSNSSNNNLESLIFTCKDHMMTSMGDVDGYSVLWFSPKATFKKAKTVAWNVNVTNLGPRQWWEVAIIPAGTPKVTAIDWVADVANTPTYPAGSVVAGNGPFGNTLHIHANGADHNPSWQPICGEWALDPEGCASKPIRRPWSLTDNGNGTVTLDFDGRKYSVPGSFPSEFEVVFKDHNYTPDKDGPVAGHTWHWDNIEVR